MHHYLYMGHNEDRKLKKSLKNLEANSSPRVAKFLKWIQNPKARVYRIPLAIAIIILGFFGGVLPIAGVWMIPLGLALLALDVPFLKKPVAKFILWIFEKWNNFKLRKVHIPNR